jgi:putative DNA primase/helicase
MNHLEPWPDPVDEAETLYGIEAQLRRYASMPEGSPELTTLWVQFSWAIKASQIAPLLLLTSPMRRCGKTTVLNILRSLVPAPQSNINVSPAALYTAIDQRQCTLLLDEADNWISKRGPVTSILNAGHSRDSAYVPRIIGGVLIEYSVYAAIAIAAIGAALPPTLEDRSVIVRMRRKRPHETLERFRKDRTNDLTELARKACRWGLDNNAALQAADPQIPAGLSDRTADNVRFLLAIADTAGGGWPKRARRAVEICCAESVENEDEAAIIRDLVMVFKEHAAAKFRSGDLVRELTKLDPRRYRNLTPNALARLLDPFDIRPRVLRFGNHTPRGYECAQFADAMERYEISLDDALTPPIRPTATTATAATPPQRQAVDEYMTAMPVAEAIMRTTVRVIETEANTAEAGGAEILRPPGPDCAERCTTIIPSLADLWWNEPFAGSGNILRQMPAERRIGYDINPRDNGAFGITQADYRTQRLDPEKKWVVVTNPPFGRQSGDKQGGPQTLFAWAAGQICVVAIGIIAPHSFQSHAVENRLDRYFHRVHREVLPPDSFLRNGQKKWSPAIFDVWVRRDYMRDLIVVRDTHPDWEFLPTSRMAEADVWMQNWGVGFGDIKTPDNLGKTKAPAWHWFIKDIRPGTTERLKWLNWREIAYPTATAPRIHKSEVVRAYIGAYGDPEAPDYNPENRGASENIAAPEAPAPTPPDGPPEAPAAADLDSHPDLEWIPLRRGYDEASLWIGRRGPNIGKILDGTKQAPTIPGDYYALRCEASAMAILRSIRWRSLAVSGILSKRTIRREYTRAKLRRLANQ